MAKKKNDNNKLIAENRKGGYNYEILDTLEAGIALTGTEVKSLRSSRMTLGESYAGPQNGNIYLHNADIAEYREANQFNHERRRSRLLLLHKKEINRLSASVQRDGLTIIPLKMYFNDKGRAKVLIGLAKGKKIHDKRETEKMRDWNRDKARLMRDKG